MNSAEKQTVLHCLKSMIDEEVCEECPLYGMTGTDHCEKDCVRLAINALEQEPCTDAISRQAVLEKAICVPIARVVTEDKVIYRKIVFADEIENLPPVNPTEKVGHWIPVSEGLPEKDGDYLVTVKGMRNYIKCCYFALNLYKVDKYDFENKKGVAGFYGCDSEYGYYEMTEVIAWCELPEPYKTSPTGAESEVHNE